MFLRVAVRTAPGQVRRGLVVQRRAMPLVKKQDIPDKPAGEGCCPPAKEACCPPVAAPVTDGSKAAAELSADEMRAKISEGYANTVATGGGEQGCCTGFNSGAVGYSKEELAAVGESDLGVGCGTPIKLAQLKRGEYVLDLGSGAGIDCVLASKEVGAKGKVVGVDMTPAMLLKARGVATEKQLGNVTYRLGEIEHLPVSNGEFDVVVSNCVINLSTDKEQVLRECFRALHEGGRIAVSDVVKTAEMPQRLQSVEAMACWVTGAHDPIDLERKLTAAGFVDVRVDLKPGSREFIANWMPGSGAEDYIMSADVTARKPGTARVIEDTDPAPEVAAKKSKW